MLKKEEIIIFNKIDLIDGKELKYKKKNFNSKTGKEILVLSTLDKKLVRDIKEKIVKYVS